MFHQLLPDAIVQAGGWTILHSLWQGAFITLLLFLLLRNIPKQTPALRYHLCLGALMALLAGVFCTFLLYYQPGVGIGATATGGLLPMDATNSPIFAGGLTWQDRLAGLFPFLLQVWLAGIIVMGLRMLFEVLYLQRLRSVKTQAVEHHWIQELDRLARKIGINHYVDLRESALVNGPLLIGFFKPVILLPVGLLANLTPLQVECILAHELAHVRRMDYLINFLQSIVEVVLFFNPAVWWISSQIREEREHCCDEMAIRTTSDRMTLVKTLTQLEEWRLQSRRLSLAFQGRPAGILSRVQRLLGLEYQATNYSKGLWSLTIFSIIFGFAVMEHKKAADVDQPITEMLPLEITERPSVIIDTIPFEELKKKIAAVQEEMQQLQEKMMKSPEMERMQELSKAYQKEMELAQEQFRNQNGGYEELMREQQQIAEQMERMQQEVLQSSTFKALDAERERLTVEYERNVDKITEAFIDRPVEKSFKLDSLRHVYEKLQEMLEMKFEKAFGETQKKMEAFERSNHFREIELKMQAMERNMAEVMEGKVKPMEKEMERLEIELGEQFERRMDQLSEQMEKLQRELFQILELRKQK